MRSRFQRVTAPGLPGWPKLYVDRKSRRAIVMARHATWRSYFCAARAAVFLTWCSYLVIVAVIWNLTQDFESAYRVVLTLVPCAILFPVAKFVLTESSVGFLARQIFPTRTRVWVSSKAFAFRCRMYARPVVIWRQWKGQNVQISFIMNRDDEAAREQANAKPNQRSLQVYLNEAMMLEAVVSSSNAASPMARGNQLLRRSIPVTEISSRMARKFSTVLNAAVAATSEVTEQHSQHEHGGQDIDG